MAVLGPNGSGKTTLLYHLLGLLRSEEGLVRVLGVDPAREWKSIRRRIGVVLQNVDEQILAPSVLDDVAFSPRQYGLPESEVRDLVSDALARVGSSTWRRACRTTCREARSAKWRSQARS